MNQHKFETVEIVFEVFYATSNLACLTNVEYLRNKMLQHQYSVEN